jgi:hypothetical protein
VDQGFARSGPVARQEYVAEQPRVAEGDGEALTDDRVIPAGGIAEEDGIPEPTTTKSARSIRAKA